MLSTVDDVIIVLRISIEIPKKQRAKQLSTSRTAIIFAERCRPSNFRAQNQLAIIHPPQAFIACFFTEEKTRLVNVRSKRGLPRFCRDNTDSGT